MAYCEVIRKKQYEKYEMIRRRNNWDEQVLRYINDSKSWDYSFENEFSISDCEQSFLSRAVFAILMGVPLNKVVANVIYILDDSVYWFFDVMHNPKIDKNDQNRLASKLGLDSVERYKWEKIYHTIGNFSPIPWPKEKWFSGRHLQWYHAKPCHENWSIFLSDLQNHWGEMKEYKTINFKEYIKRTYQHLYCEEVFCDLKKDLIENNLDLKCIDWQKKKEQWEIVIDDSWEKNNNRLMITGLSQDQDYEKLAEDIVILIEARGRMIVSVGRLLVNGID